MVENRLIFPLIALNAPLGTSVSFPPMFTLWDAKTSRPHTVTSQEKVKTLNLNPCLYEEGGDVTVQKINARDKAYKRQRGLCYYCKRTVGRGEATLDHRVPECEGGNLQAGNAVMACYECNHKKGAMPEAVFRQGEEAQRAWKLRHGQLHRALNADPSFALAYADLRGHSTIKARALLAVAEAKRRNSRKDSPNG